MSNVSKLTNWFKHHVDIVLMGILLALLIFIIFWINSSMYNRNVNVSPLCTTGVVLKTHPGEANSEVEFKFSYKGKRYINKGKRDAAGVVPGNSILVKFSSEDPSFATILYHCQQQIAYGTGEKCECE